MNTMAPSKIQEQIEAEANSYVNSNCFKHEEIIGKKAYVDGATAYAEKVQRLAEALKASQSFLEEEVANRFDGNAPKRLEKIIDENSKALADWEKGKGPEDDGTLHDTYPGFPLQ